MIGLKSALMLLIVVCMVHVSSAIAVDVPAPVLQAEADRVAVMDRIKDTVLAVFSAGGQGGGSGVVISPDGYALTNFHVAKPSGIAMKCGMADGKVYDAVIVGFDPVGDVALIKLFGRDDFPHAELGDSDQVEAGDWAIVMGNPFLLAADFQPTVTYGIISGVHRYQFPAGTLLEYSDCIQTDASINPGNSGGPLFSAQGQLIGINGRGSFEKRGRVNVGVGYAISINQIKNFLGCLKSGRIVDHATLGATVAFDEQRRVVVSDILEESDAYRRGLRYDDEIAAFGGRTIETPNGFKNVLGIFPRGWRVPLTFRRDGKRNDVLVRLAGVHSPSELIEKTLGRPHLPMPIPDEDEKKKEKDSEKKPDENKRPSRGNPAPIPVPIPRPGDDRSKRLSPDEAPIPEIVHQHFEKKRAYANYYFNKLHRKRVFNAWNQSGDFSMLGGPWSMAGPLEGGGRFRFQITDKDVRLELPGETVTWQSSDALGKSRVPHGSGGLMTSIFLWRRMVLLGPERFGEVYYFGTLSTPKHNALADVLVGIHGGVECRFTFDPDNGRLTTMEMFPEEGVDPCEIDFSEYRQHKGRFVPGRMEVRFGDQPFGRFQIDRFDFPPEPDTTN